MGYPSRSQLKQEPLLRLLVLEDFDFRANGGIETVLDSLLPQLALRCDRLVWVLAEYKKESTKSRLAKCHPIEFQFLHSRRFGKGWWSQILLNILAKVDLLNVFGNLRFRLAQYSKTQRLMSIVREYGITHLLNTGIFDQSYVDLGIPAFGIVYDTNYASEWKEKCMHNLQDYASKADGLFTISAWARDQILSEVPTAVPQKVHAIPLAVAPPPLHLNVDSGLVNVQCSTSTFLYPASFNPHKNHLLLLEALSCVYSRGHDFNMIFCGCNTHLLRSKHRLDNNQLELARSFLVDSSPGFQSRISSLGSVDRPYLESLYQHACCILLPTSCEGFGLPLSEAAFRGVPVVCSSIPPFKEQCQIYGLDRGVIFVQDFRPSSWAQAIINMCSNPCVNPSDCLQNTLAWKKWTWNDVASSYEKIIRM